MTQLLEGRRPNSRQAEQEHQRTKLPLAPVGDAAEPASPDRISSPLATAYRPDVDGLRALAVLAVLGYHAFPDHVSGGFVGVDVFFIISGYLITGLITGALAQQRFSLGAFYTRRVVRIFPALAALLASCFLYGWLYLGAEDFARLGTHIVAGAAFFSNFLLLHETGYFDVAAEAKPLLHLWSLGIEEQFYLLWPVVLAWAWRRRLPLVAFTAIIAATSFALCWWLTDTHRDIAFYSPVSRWWELMAGALLVLVQQRWPRMAPRRPGLWSVTGLALIVVAIVLLDGRTRFPGLAALLPVGGALLMIAAGPAAWANRHLLAARPAIGIGLISYPLYLWHWPLLVFASRHDWPLAAPAVNALALLLAFMLAWLTWRFLERPLRSRAAHRGAVWGLVAALAVCAAGGLVLLQGGGLEFRSANRLAAADARWEAARRWTNADYFSAQCQQRYPQAYYCMVEEGAPTPSVALLGDSFANALYPGLRDYYKRQGRTLLMLGNGGCPPLLNVQSNLDVGPVYCSRETAAYMAQIAADARINTVVLTGNWHLYLVGARFRPNPRRPFWQIRFEGRPELTHNPAVFAAAFEQTVNYLHASGKRLIFLLQPPELDFAPERCAPGRHPAAENCRVARSRVERYVAEYRGLLDPILSAHPEVQVVDPLNTMCDAQYCEVARDGLPMYRDALHPSRAGSAYLGAHLELDPPSGVATPAPPR